MLTVPFPNVPRVEKDKSSMVAELNDLRGSVDHLTNEKVDTDVSLSAKTQRLT